MSQVELAGFQVSRRSVPWMLAAVVAAMLPHITHLPPWLLAVCALCVAWRWGVHRGRLSYPPMRLQQLFAVLLIGAVALHYRTLAGHEAGTAALVAMFSLKLLEMYKERDAYVVILIGYFVAATAFLFFFTLWMAGWILLVAVLLTAALVAINASLEAPRLEPLKRAVLMFAQSVPLAILLFVVMPRLGPLWSIGLEPGDAQTGVSDEMSPGSIGSLVESDELAFRVDFDGAVMPVTSRMYWRGLTLSSFDGRTWRPGRDLERYPALTWFPRSRRPEWFLRQEAARGQGGALREWRYTVTLEPTQRPWLFALAVPYSEERTVGHVYDHSLRAPSPVKTLTRYRVTSVEGMPREAELPAWLRADTLRLPADAAPRARQWSVQERAVLSSDEAYAARVLQWFAEGGFSYTLTPPLLGAQPVDQFLFDTQRGFCEHYAGAFVLLMRAAGVPARVVAGYQGGEVNPLGGAVQVRQYDAHAWAEVWLPGRGWVEYDPTAVVAPERIARGSRVALAERSAALDTGLLGDSRLGGPLRSLGDALDYLNHGWNQWVLGFDEQSQRGFLQRWLGGVSAWRIGMLVLGTGVAVVALLALWMFRDTLFARIDPVAREYQRFCASWAARGHARRTDEGPYDYLARLSAAEPRRAVELQRFIVNYVQLSYAGRAADRDALRKLRASRLQAC